MNDKTDADSLFHEGKLIATRKEHMEQIRARAEQQKITEEQAWQNIQAELLNHISKTDNKKGASLSGLNGNLIDGLPEDSIPQDLKGTSIMDAIATGKLKLSGEHPAADLLRKTVSQTDEATEAQRQIELDMPGLQYPQVRQTVRIMPSDFNRTSLFHVGSNNLPRRFCKNEKLGRVGDGVTIFYQGEELRQTDEAVFRQIIHVARGNRPWEWISLKRCRLIQDAKGAKRHLSGKDTKEYHDIIMRLRSGLLLIQSRRRGSFITCNLLSDYEGIGDEQRVRIDPRVALLFDSYAALDENIIYSISGVAQKIYNFIQTIPHSGIHPILIKNLFELCYGRIEYLVKEYRRQLASKPAKESEAGLSDQKRAEMAINKKYSDFHRKSLPMGLDELKTIGLIISYEINRKDDKVAIVKNPLAGAQVQELDTPLPGDAADLSAKQEGLVRRMIALGVLDKKARQYLTEYDYDYIDGNLTIVETRYSSGGIENPSSYLAVALREDYRVGETYRDAQTRETEVQRAKQEEKRKQAEQALQGELEDRRKQQEAARSRFDGLPGNEQKKLVDAFSDYLREANSFLFGQFVKSGLDGTKGVASEFAKWLCSLGEA